MHMAAKTKNNNNYWFQKYGNQKALMTDFKKYGGQKAPVTI